MKALRTEPQERYATVEQFSEDLENYLESRPIRARKGDAWYRTRKLLRRYWLPVAAAALAVAGLSAGCTRGESSARDCRSGDSFRFVSWRTSCLTSMPKFDGPREPPRPGS